MEEVRLEEVRVVSSRIFIWPGVHAEVGENIRVLAPGTKQAFIFTDRKCIPIAKRVAMSLLQANYEVAGYAMYPGETRKNLATALGVFSKMAHCRIQPGSTFVTVGGGVVSDLGGFIASTYREGLRLFHVPTTLVAQVDVAVGGKTGLHVKDGRNFISSSYPPAGVFVDPTLLQTLPRPDYLAGLAEIVKYGMIQEADLLASLEENIEGVVARKPLLLEELIHRCVSIKSAVEKASQASGVGAILQYGRTIGRGLEVAGLYRKIRPGDALAVGMEAEAAIAERMGVAAPGVRKTQNRILRLLDLPTRVRGLSCGKLLEAMGLMPKTAEAHVRLALPETVGNAKHGVDVPLDVVEDALREIILPGGRLRATRPMSAPDANPT